MTPSRDADREPVVPQPDPRTALALERWRLLHRRRTTILAADGEVIGYWTPTDAAIRLQTIEHLLSVKSVGQSAGPGRPRGGGDGAADAGGA